MKPTRPTRRAASASKLLFAIILAAGVTIVPSRAPAQGCAQCLDNTAATPPKTQAAYRHAIILLIVTAGALFIGTVSFLRRQP